jgi:hypothetical protein
MSRRMPLACRTWVDAPRPLAQSPASKVTRNPCRGDPRSALMRSAPPRVSFHPLAQLVPLAQLAPLVPFAQFAQFAASAATDFIPLARRAYTMLNPTVPQQRLCGVATKNIIPTSKSLHSSQHFFSSLPSQVRVGARLSNFRPAARKFLKIKFSKAQKLPKLLSISVLSDFSRPKIFAQIKFDC